MSRIAQALRCRLRFHRWQRLDDNGWECRDCGDVVLDADVRRERLERVYDGPGDGAPPPLAGAGGASAPPF